MPNDPSALSSHSSSYSPAHSDLSVHSNVSSVGGTPESAHSATLPTASDPKTAEVAHNSLNEISDDLSQAKPINPSKFKELKAAFNEGLKGLSESLNKGQKKAEYIFGKFFLSLSTIGVSNMADALEEAAGAAGKEVSELSIDEKLKVLQETRDLYGSLSTVEKYSVPRETRLLYDSLVKLSFKNNSIAPLKKSEQEQLLLFCGALTRGKDKGQLDENGKQYVPDLPLFLRESSLERRKFLKDLIAGCENARGKVILQNFKKIEFEKLGNLINDLTTKKASLPGGTPFTNINDLARLKDALGDLDTGNLDATAIENAYTALEIVSRGIVAAVKASPDITVYQELPATISGACEALDYVAEQYLQEQLRHSPREIKELFQTLQTLGGSELKIPVNYRLAIFSYLTQNPNKTSEIQSLLNEMIQYKNDQIRSLALGKPAQNFGEFNVKFKQIFDIDNPEIVPNRSLTQFSIYLTAMCGATINTQILTDSVGAAVSFDRGRAIRYKDTFEDALAMAPGLPQQRAALSKEGYKQWPGYDGLFTHANWNTSGSNERPFHFTLTLDLAFQQNDLTFSHRQSNIALDYSSCSQVLSQTSLAEAKAAIFVLTESIVQSEKTLPTLTDLQNNEVLAEQLRLLPPALRHHISRDNNFWVSIVNKDSEPIQALEISDEMRQTFLTLVTPAYEFTENVNRQIAQSFVLASKLDPSRPHEYLHGIEYQNNTIQIEQAKKLADAGIDMNSTIDSMTIDQLIVFAQVTQDAVKYLKNELSANPSNSRRETIQQHIRNLDSISRECSGGIIDNMKEINIRKLKGPNQSLDYIKLLSSKLYGMGINDLTIACAQFCFKQTYQNLDAKGKEKLMETLRHNLDMFPENFIDTEIVKMNQDCFCGGRFEDVVPLFMPRTHAPVSLNLNSDAYVQLDPATRGNDERRDDFLRVHSQILDKRYVDGDTNNFVHILEDLTKICGNAATAESLSFFLEAGFLTKGYNYLSSAFTLYHDHGGAHAHKNITTDPFKSIVGLQIEGDEYVITKRDCYQLVMAEEGELEEKYIYTQTTIRIPISLFKEAAENGLSEGLKERFIKNVKSSLDVSGVISKEKLTDLFTGVETKGIKKLNADDISKIPADAIARLTPEQLQEFSPKQVAFFTPQQLQHLRPTQIKSFSDAALNALQIKINANTETSITLSNTNKLIESEIENRLTTSIDNEINRINNEVPNEKKLSALENVFSKITKLKDGPDKVRFLDLIANSLGTLEGEGAAALLQTCKAQVKTTIQPLAKKIADNFNDKAKAETESLLRGEKVNTTLVTISNGTGEEITLPACLVLDMNRNIFILDGQPILDHLAVTDEDRFTIGKKLLERFGKKDEDGKINEKELQKLGLILHQGFSSKYMMTLITGLNVMAGNISELNDVALTAPTIDLREEGDSIIASYTFTHKYSSSTDPINNYAFKGLYGQFRQTAVISKDDISDNAKEAQDVRVMSARVVHSDIVVGVENVSDLSENLKKLEDGVISLKKIPTLQIYTDDQFRALAEKAMNTPELRTVLESIIEQNTRNQSEPQKNPLSEKDIDWIKRHI